jgi:hypothetical protein
MRVCREDLGTLAYTVPGELLLLMCAGVHRGETYARTV